MGKRYYCDYCDKYFADRGSNRKNHLSGLHHQKNKQIHFDSFDEIDPAAVLAESSKLQLCHEFVRAGTCPYGRRCRWSHVTNEVRADLENQIQALREAQEKKRKEEERIPTVDEWLEKRQTKKQKTEGKSDTVTRSPGQFFLPEYSVPPTLVKFQSLPPSLLPPPVDSFNYLPLEEWG